MSSNTASELKPCPFCGGEAEHRAFTGNGFVLPRVEYTQVKCPKCRIETEPMQPFSGDRAILAWNTRLLETVDEGMERRTLLQVRTFITKHGIKEVDAYCVQRLHDIRMDARHRDAVLSAIQDVAK